MKTELITVDGIRDMEPTSHGMRSIEMRLYVNDKQRRDIAMAMIGGMPSEDAYAWARAAFPEWFEPDTNISNNPPSTTAFDDQMGDN